jgi:hypothetical protein
MWFARTCQRETSHACGLRPPTSCIIAARGNFVMEHAHARICVEQHARAIPRKRAMSKALLGESVACHLRKSAATNSMNQCKVTPNTTEHVDATLWTLAQSPFAFRCQRTKAQRAADPTRLWGSVSRGPNGASYPHGCGTLTKRSLSWLMGG